MGLLWGTSAAEAARNASLEGLPAELHTFLTSSSRQVQIQAAQRLAKLLSGSQASLDVYIALGLHFQTFLSGILRLLPQLSTSSSFRKAPAPQTTEAHRVGIAAASRLIVALPDSLLKQLAKPEQPQSRTLILALLSLCTDPRGRHASLCALARLLQDEHAAAVAVRASAHQVLLCLLDSPTTNVQDLRLVLSCLYYLAADEEAVQNRLLRCGVLSHILRICRSSKHEALYEAVQVLKMLCNSQLCCAAVEAAGGRHILAAICSSCLHQDTVQAAQVAIMRLAAAKVHKGKHGAGGKCASVPMLAPLAPVKTKIEMTRATQSPSKVAFFNSVAKKGGTASSTAAKALSRTPPTASFGKGGPPPILLQQHVSQPSMPGLSPTSLHSHSLSVPLSWSPAKQPLDAALCSLSTSGACFQRSLSSTSRHIDDAESPPRNQDAYMSMGTDVLTSSPFLAPTAVLPGRAKNADRDDTSSTSSVGYGPAAQNEDALGMCGPDMGLGHPGLWLPFPPLPVVRLHAPRTD